MKETKDIKLKDISPYDFTGEEILTSRGDPTVEITLHTNIGTVYASCPSGKSTGEQEAAVVVDGGCRYNGRGVKNTISSFLQELKKDISKLDELHLHDQKQIDNFLVALDGTDNLTRFGANHILPVSQCCLRLAALSEKKELFHYISTITENEHFGKMPIPHFNIINGGEHSGNDLDFQEIMIAFNKPTFSENLESAVLFYAKLKKIIEKKYGGTAVGVGDEGGFAPPVKTLDEALDLIMETSEELQSKNLHIAIDAAANSFYKNGKYKINISEGNKITRKELSTDELAEYYLEIIKKYSLIKIIEDPFYEKDYLGWKRLTAESKIIILGDDLITTNKKNVELAAKDKLCNAVLIKPNQIGYVSGAMEAIDMARRNSMSVMVSHRSAETEDTFIADFAVGMTSDYIKAGAPCRGERIVKYNRLLKIERRIKEYKK